MRFLRHVAGDTNLQAVIALSTFGLRVSYVSITSVADSQELLFACNCVRKFAGKRSA